MVLLRKLTALNRRIIVISLTFNDIKGSERNTENTCKSQSSSAPTESLDKETSSFVFWLN